MRGIICFGRTNNECCPHCAPSRLGGWVDTGYTSSVSY